MFETNSSSCHCMVICSKADWGKFVHAELFAVCAENKGSYPQPLIDIDGVYALMELEIKKEYSLFWSEVKPTIELVKWIYTAFSIDMINPGTDPSYDEMEFRPATDNWWVENAPDGLKEFISENVYTLGELLDWVALTYTPYSYEMIRVLSKNFTMEYDEYPSIQPHEASESDLTIWGPEYLGTDAIICRAIWYA